MTGADRGIGGYGSNNVGTVLVLFILLVIIACAGFW
ncbi:sporulation protein YjcZ [Paenibacillus agaridevorans]|nr:sporulation protein YjcZ [Paenibacillus agaridevorans]